MKFTFNIKNRNMYLVSAIFILLLGISIIVAYTQSIPNPGHGGDSVWVSVAGQEKTLQQAIDDNSISSSSSGGYNILAESTDDTVAALFTLTSSGITFDTRHASSNQNVNPILYKWPSNVTQIVFVAETKGPYCAGGQGIFSLTSTTTNALCTQYQYNGITLTKVGQNVGDWIRLRINGVDMIYCKNQLGGTPTGTYYGTYGDSNSGTICIYSKSGGDWSGEINQIEVQENSVALDTAQMNWKIWYK